MKCVILLYTKTNYNKKGAKIILVTKNKNRLSKPENGIVVNGNNNNNNNDIDGYLGEILIKQL